MLLKLDKWQFVSIMFLTINLGVFIMYFNDCTPIILLSEKPHGVSEANKTFAFVVPWQLSYQDQKTL